MRLLKSKSSNWSIPGVFMCTDHNKTWWWWTGSNRWCPMQFAYLVSTEPASRLEFLIATGQAFKEPSEYTSVIEN